MFPILNRFILIPSTLCAVLASGGKPLSGRSPLDVLCNIWFEHEPICNPSGVSISLINFVPVVTQVTVAPVSGHKYFVESASSNNAA